jgi:large subunit ribosomal protein L30
MNKKVKKDSKVLLVQQIASPIRRNKIQREYLKSLGLNKMNKVKELKATPEVEGLLKKAHHLVKVIEQV